ncbi:hypothetical protein B0I35DRAFT_484149 [Stachybotrys elegans]|uniref:Uncharacterized protein n=1 Tax=Stachybotrys elegans TaxID=80388 RepID=A0A8K0SFI4_9HYPO|nr:hypothetical protein B0I35DRAFT_484149 [Stachybotrys elegans]
MFTTLDLNRNFETLQFAQADTNGRPSRPRGSNNNNRRSSLMRSITTPTFRITPASPQAETPATRLSSGTTPATASVTSLGIPPDTRAWSRSSDHVLADVPFSQNSTGRRRKGVRLKWARLVGQHSVGNITRYIKAYIYYNGECVPINNDDLLLVGDLGTEDKSIYFAIRHTIQMKFITEVIRKTDFPYHQLDTKRWACRSFSDLTLPAPLVRDMSLFQQKDALLVLVVDEGQAPDPRVLEAYKGAPLQWHFNEFSLSSFDFSSFVRTTLISFGTS